MNKLLLLSLTAILFCCNSDQQDERSIKENIIQTLENETKYFCERNLEEWQNQWSHEAFTSKMYAGETEFEELIGWKAINQFTINHIKTNPNSIPIPKVNYDFDIYLFEKSALVLYSKVVNDKKVRETRLMVLDNDQWKIARMQTIY